MESQNHYGKPIYESKTMVVNSVAIVITTLLEAWFKVQIPAQFQVSLICVVNMILRLITKEPVLIKGGHHNNENK